MKKGQYLETLLRSPKTVFTLEDIALLWQEPRTQAVRVRLSYYVRHGKLYRIRKGLYAKDKNYNKLELATRIFTPSYVSFETILVREGLIFQFHTRISVASYLTRDIEVDGQTYSFRKIKMPILTHPMGIENKNEISSANRERAFLDTVYLQAGYQIDNLNGLDWDKIFEMLPIYQNQSMNKRVQRYYKQVVQLDEFIKLAPDLEVMTLIKAGETDTVEFKVGAFLNPHKGKKDDSMIANVLEEIAAFMNTNGGIILIGVEDNGNILGIYQEYQVVDPHKPNWDGYSLALIGSLRRLSISNASQYCKIERLKIDGKDVCQIVVQFSPEPVHINEKFFVREGNRKRALSVREGDYIKMHWK